MQTGNHHDLGKGLGVEALVTRLAAVATYAWGRRITHPPGPALRYRQDADTGIEQSASAGLAMVCTHPDESREIPMPEPEPAQDAHAEDADTPATAETETEIDEPTVYANRAARRAKG